MTTPARFQKVKFIELIKGDVFVRNVRNSQNAARTRYTKIDNFHVWVENTKGLSFKMKAKRFEKGEVCFLRHNQYFEFDESMSPPVTGGTEELNFNP